MTARHDAALLFAFRSPRPACIVPVLALLTLAVASPSRADPPPAGPGEPFANRDTAYQARQGKPPEATPAGFRVDQSYKDPDMVQDLLAAYAQRFPDISRLVELGRTAQGRPILALKISDAPDRDEDEPAVLLIGGNHGGELLSIEFVIDAIQVLLERYETDKNTRRWVDGFEIWCVPQANPDGTWAFLHVSDQMDRKNARDTNGNGRIDPTDGVDLNRNYPFRWGQGGPTASSDTPESNYYRGPAPASEAETQAVMRLAESERFVVALSFHTQATSLLVPYTIDGTRSPQPNEAWVLAQEIAPELPVQPNGRRLRVRRQIYPVDGTDQDWMRAALGTVAYIVEGTYESPLDAGRRAASIASIRPLWMAILDRYLRGPTVFGHVADSQGRPIAAQIVVMGTRRFQGERWSARCRDGRFDRFLPRPGKVTIEARQGGRVLARRSAQAVVGAPVRLDLTVPDDATTESGCPVDGLTSRECARAAAQGTCLRPGPAP